MDFNFDHWQKSASNLARTTRPNSWWLNSSFDNSYQVLAIGIRLISSFESLCMIQWFLFLVSFFYDFVSYVGSEDLGVPSDMTSGMSIYLWILLKGTLGGPLMPNCIVSSHATYLFVYTLAWERGISSDTNIVKFLVLVNWHVIQASTVIFHGFHLIWIGN